MVNCIVLGRAEACFKNDVVSAAVDGLGIGAGFTFALVLLGSVRELLGSGKLFNYTIYSENYVTLLVVLAPGAFIVLGYLIAIINRVKKD